MTRNRRREGDAELMKGKSECRPGPIGRSVNVNDIIGVDRKQTMIILAECKG